MTDQEQKIERLDSKVERLDEPDVEAHKLDRAEGRAEAGKLDEPDVEAHRFDKFEKVEKVERHDA